MGVTKDKCSVCGRFLWETEGDPCGDCGLAAMFGADPNVLCVEKKSGELLTQEMIDKAK